jgi:hypothetical protein
MNSALSLKKNWGHTPFLITLGGFKRLGARQLLGAHGAKTTFAKASSAGPRRLVDARFFQGA